MVRKQRVPFVVACGVLVAIAACNKGGGSARKSAPQGEVVARVGGRPITKSYYEQRLAKMERRFLPDTLDLKGRKQFLDFIVNKELMALKAEELKYGEDPRIVNSIKLYEDNLAANAAIDRLTEGKLTVTQAESDAFHEQKKRVVVVKHILVKSRREAEEVRAKLLKGADFDSLADVYSVVPRTDTNTGEELPLAQRVAFGEVEFGKAIIPVEEAVFATAIDQVSEPVETGYGWHIFKPIHEKTVTVTPPDADARRRIETQIQMRRKRQITEAYYQEIADAHGLKMDEDALVVVYEQFPLDVNPEDAPDPATEVKPVIPFSPADRARTLLEVDGRKVTIGEFSDKYDETSWFERPKRVTGVLGFKYWIRDKWFRDFQLERARKDGVYELPQVADEIKLRKEQMMVSLLHQNLVGAEAPDPTPEQVQEFYDSHKKFYIDQEKRKVTIIAHPQERVVRRAYDEIKSGQNFVEVAVRYHQSATGPGDVQSIAFTRDNTDFAPIAPATFALAKEGDYTEPFRTTDFWVILQLSQITPERQLKLDEIRDAVATDWKNDWQEKKLNELLAEWKRNIKVEIDEDVLMSAAVNRDDVVVPGRATSGELKRASGGAPTRPGREKRMRVVGWVAVAATALVAAGALSGCGRGGPEPGKTSGGGGLGAGVLAQVNDARLTEADLQQLIPTELRESITGAEVREILDRWVRTELLYQRARSEGLDDNSEVAARLLELQRDLLADEMLQRELAARVKIGNEELQEYYRVHQAEYTQELQLKHILVDTREEAEQIMGMLRNGAVFEDLARVRSRDASASRGGDLGFLGKGAMNPAFEPHVFDAVAGAAVGPIATTFGFHVVKVAARRPAPEPLSFEAVRDEILHSLLLEKQQAAQQLVFEEMRRGAQVQIATSYAGMALEPAPKRMEEPRWTGRGGAFGTEEGATHPADTLGTAPE